MATYNPNTKTQSTAKMSAATQNQTAEHVIRNYAVRRLQSLNPVTVVPANVPVLTVSPVPVGLVLGFYVKVDATIHNASAITINATDFNAANIVSQFQFQDLSNQTRIQTTGYHINFLNSWKSKRPYGAALLGSGGTNTGAYPTATGLQTAIDDPTNYGSNWTVNTCSATIATTVATDHVVQWYYVPLAYNPDNPRVPDFRGAIYAGTTAANLQLQITFAGSGPGQVAVATGTDSTSAVFVGASAGSVAAVTISSATVTVYQDYYDQIPDGAAFGAGPGILLPLSDISTIYELKNSPLSGMPANAETGYQYANFRSFLSTMVVYVQASATGARGVGADINYWALQSANNSYIWKAEPSYFALQVRQHMQVDFPPGVYMFDSRQSPINTQQFGVMQLLINPITVGAGNYMTVLIEDFQLLNAQGQSLPSS